MKENDRGPAQHGRLGVDGQHGHALDSCLICWVGPQGELDDDYDEYDDDDDDEHDDDFDNNDNFDETGAWGAAPYLFDNAPRESHSVRWAPGKVSWLWFSKIDDSIVPEMAKMPVDFMMTLLQMMSMNNGVGDVRMQVVMCYEKAAM